jgi:hypothetical protein
LSASDQNQSFASAVSEVSERVSVLVREEIELAKAEVTVKVTSIAKGAVAVVVGGVFGLFALIFGLITLGYGLDSLFNSVWLGFLVVFAVLLALTVFALLFALRKLKVGAPKPTMAIDEARLIRETVSSSTEGPR